MRTILLISIVFALLQATGLRAQNSSVGGITSGTNISPTPDAAACDTIFSFPATDTWNSGITFDGTYIWSSGFSSGYLYKHDLTGAVIDSVSGLANMNSTFIGGDLDFDGTHILFFPEESDTLYKLDPVTGNVVSRWNISPCNGNCFGVAFDGTHIWISEYGPGNIYKIDASNGNVLNTFPIATSSYMLPIKFFNGELYGLGVFPGMIYKIDTASGSVLGSASWCLGYSLGFCLVNNVLWGSSSQISSGGTQRIYQFDTLILNMPAIFDSEINAVEIFPNPASDAFDITFSNQIQNGTIDFYNAMGKLIWSGKISDEVSQNISLSFAVSGLYFVRIFDGKNYFTKKLVVNR